MHRVDNALILAAGFSSRFVPICYDLPKGLLSVKGQTLIERQISQLNQIGIKDIYIVVGYYAEKFEFLREKYGVKLIFNKDYATKNNFASLYCAKDILANTLISSSDLFFTRNIFQNSAEHSYYLSVFVKGKTNQRCLTLDKNDKIIKTTYSGNDSWITYGGQAFFSEDTSKKLIKLISDEYDNPNSINKYWVDFQDENLEDVPMYIKRVEQSDIIEFNTLASLREFDKDFRAFEISKTIRMLCKEVNSNELELTNFKPIRENNYPVAFEFECKGNRYKYNYNDKMMEVLHTC